MFDKIMMPVVLDVASLDRLISIMDATGLDRNKVVANGLIMLCGICDTKNDPKKMSRDIARQAKEIWSWMDKVQSQREPDFVA